MKNWKTVRCRLCWEEIYYLGQEEEVPICSQCKEKLLGKEPEEKINCAVCKDLLPKKVRCSFNEIGDRVEESRKIYLCKVCFKEFIRSWLNKNESYI